MIPTEEYLKKTNFRLQHIGKIVYVVDPTDPHFLIVFYGLRMVGVMRFDKRKYEDFSQIPNKNMVSFNVVPISDKYVYVYGFCNEQNR